MIKKIQYTTSDERQTIINQNKDLFLVEEQNISEGNYLIFDDARPVQYQLRSIEEITIQSAINAEYVASLIELGL